MRPSKMVTYDIFSFISSYSPPIISPFSLTNIFGDIISSFRVFERYKKNAFENMILGELNILMFNSDFKKLF